MADETEVETKDLQEKVEELHKEHEAPERESHWLRYVALTTAVLAAFGAVAALQSGALANEGMMGQLQASDKWGEYQASKTKTHLYGIAAAGLMDRGVTPSAAEGSGAKGNTEPDLSAEAGSARLSGYLNEVKKETEKGKSLGSEASKLQDEAKRMMESHHRFAYSVALLQVAIALGAVSALTRNKWVWIGSLVLGAIGIVYFGMGFNGG